MPSDPKWKLVEKIIKVLEKSLSPESRVLHNVNLPVLVSQQGATRQCDVVIMSGTQERPTISIVEVQDRESKPSIGDFCNWLVKMEDVGAQHLVCVSEEGFPSSIMEKARFKGPSVILMTLKQVEHGSLPIKLLENSIYTNRRFLKEIRIAKIDYKHNEESSSAFELSLVDKIFELNNIFYSARDLIYNFLDVIESKSGILVEGLHEIEISYPLASEKLYWINEGNKHEIIKFKLVVVLEVSRHTFPLECKAYKQVGKEHNLAWIMEGKINLQNRMQDVQITLVPDNGFYRVALWNLQIE